MVPVPNVRTSFVSGSIREIVRSSALSTQTAPSPTLIALVALLAVTRGLDYLAIGEFLVEHPSLRQ